MNEQTRKEWDALRESFDRRRSELAEKYARDLNTVDDAYRRAENEREDRRHKFIAELKAEHRKDVECHIITRRSLGTARRMAMATLEQERQAAYSKFIAEHNEEQE